MSLRWTKSDYTPPSLLQFASSFSKIVSLPPAPLFLTIFGKPLLFLSTPSVCPFPLRICAPNCIVFPVRTYYFCFWRRIGREKPRCLVFFSGLSRFSRDDFPTEHRYKEERRGELLSYFLFSESLMRFSSSSEAFCDQTS